MQKNKWNLMMAMTENMLNLYLEKIRVSVQEVRVEQDVQVIEGEYLVLPETVDVLELIDWHMERV